MANNLAIRMRKFNKICPITGYKEKSIRVGAHVIVETNRGLETGQIVSCPRGFPRGMSRDVRLRKVLRYATDADMKRIEELVGKEEKALKTANKKVLEHELPIKFISVEFLFDDTKVHLYYKITESKRGLNLKELNKDLASTLQARINMHQVSPRDEARFFSGLGPCGRPLCCVAWLDKPRHITVKMVKDQGIPIGSIKTAGICGRLMCCMQYELDASKKKK
ncbi:regulatory iron-sulfur-containing complex subunit RicT [Candidatus Margulisiibacteriota bacterium]